MAEKCDASYYALLCVAAIGCGCIETDNMPTTLTIPPSTMTSATQQSTTSTSTLTTSTTLVNSTVVCLEARDRERTYKRCKASMSGGVILPPDQRKTCVEIQKNAGQYLRDVFHGLKYCLGVPADGLSFENPEPSFCTDLPEDTRDDCYLSVRMCGKITDPTMRKQCTEAGQLN